MSLTLKVKQSAVASKVPTVSQLTLGELAVNTTDGKLFLKKSVSGVESIVDLTQASVPPATQSVPGTMSATDKAKLDAITGTNTGDQTNITGNAATATKLATPVTINGVSFDGSESINYPMSSAPSLYGSVVGPNELPSARNATFQMLYVGNTYDGLSDGGTMHSSAHVSYTGTSQQLAFTANNNMWLRGSTSSSTWGSWRKVWDSGNLTNLNQLTNGPGYTTNLGTVTSVTGTGAISVTPGSTPVVSIVAATTTVPGTMSASDKLKLDQISGTNTGDQTNISGNAATATKFATTRNINGVAFDGSIDITVPAVDTATPRQATSTKDASGGYVGLTSLKINFKNALNTFTSFFTNANTAARTYTFQDRDGVIADNTDLATKSNIATSVQINSALGASVDLNTILTPGLYQQTSSPNAASGTNYPAANSGWLQVYSPSVSATSGVVQIYFSANTTQIYSRALVTSVWSTWRSLADDVDLALLAPLLNPALTNPTANKAPRFNSSQLIVTSEWLRENAFVYRGQISTALDLNTLISPGYYGISSVTTVSLGSNYPSTTWGWVQVMAFSEGSTSGVCQNYFDTRGATFTRFLYAGTWTAWFSTAYTGGVVDFTDTAVRGRLLVKTTVTSVTTTSVLGTSAVMGRLITSTPPGPSAITLTLPTGTSMYAAMGSALATGDSIEWSIVNTGGFTTTVVTNTGNTVTGSMVVAAGTSARFLTLVTGANACATYRLG